MQIADLKTGQLVTVSNDPGIFVVYTNAVNVSGFTTYLVSIDFETSWVSLPLDKETYLKDTRITAVFEPQQPYYTGKTAIKYLQNSNLIWEKQQVEEMTLEQVCIALGKNIKIIKG